MEKLKLVGLKADQVVVKIDKDKIYLPDEDSVAGFIPLFRFQDMIVTEMKDIPEGLTAIGLREAFANLPETEKKMIAKGKELLNWDYESKFCGRCGAEMIRISEISKGCLECHTEIFPTLAPAIVVLVIKNDKALLVRSVHAKKPYYALVAGFVETGESLEECVIREVREETSLEIDNIRYIGSQAWPFPNNIMVGFVADYKAGEIFFADKELSDGDFFSRNETPAIPPPPSLTRYIIDLWLTKKIPYINKADR